MKKIICDNVDYRKGFIEVSDDIHEDLINLEVWSIHPDIDISVSKSVFGELPDEAFTGNVEIELNVDEAQLLVNSLQEAIARLKNEGQIPQKDR